VDLDRVATDLYALAPGAFVAARNEQAAVAKAAGDTALAASIRKLRKPTVSAWLANQLVRQRPGDIEELIELGSRLRRAQRELAGDELRELSHQRQVVVSTLRRAGYQLARRADLPVSDAATDELSATLQAATADADLGDALRSGRLTSALRYAGTGLDGFGRSPGAPSHPPRSRPGEPAGPQGLARSTRSTRSTGNPGSPRVGPAPPPKERQKEPVTGPRRTGGPPSAGRDGDAVRAASAAREAGRRAAAARGRAAAARRELAELRPSLERARSEADRLEREMEKLQRRAVDAQRQQRLAEAEERASQRRLDERKRRGQ
jgi:hypothetical protein